MLNQLVNKEPKNKTKTWKQRKDFNHNKDYLESTPAALVGILCKKKKRKEKN